MLGKRRRTTTENTASAGFSPTWYASAALMVAVILALVGLLNLHRGPAPLTHPSGGTPSRRTDQPGWGGHQPGSHPTHHSN